MNCSNCGAVVILGPNGGWACGNCGTTASPTKFWQYNFSGLFAATHVACVSALFAVWPARGGNMGMHDLWILPRNEYGG